MAGILKVDDLRGNTSAGDITITDGSVTMKLQDGLTRQWCLFQGANASLSLDGSLNTSSLTDVGTGLYYANYTNNMDSANYFSDGDADALRHINTEPVYSDKNYIRVFNSSNNAADTTHTRGLAIGDLA